MNDTPPQVVINGNRFVFEASETILDVARRNHVCIPTLCHLRAAVPTGACRICVVEVEKARSLLPACATPAADGMVVQTDSPRVIADRKMILELLLASGSHNCAISGRDGAGWEAFQLQVQADDEAVALCPVWGDCRLQDLAYRYQVTAARFAPTPPRYAPETVNPFIVRDFSRCIQCGRCVQACREVQVNNAIDFGYRGAAVKIVAAGDRPLKDSDCVFCGECVQACPVGALVEKDARHRVRPWQTGRVKTTCTYCGVGCQLYLHVQNGRVVKADGADGVPPNFGSLCVKGRFGFDFVNSGERLTQPLVKQPDGSFKNASWDEALDLVAQRLGDIKNAHGADSIGVLTSARITNEENYLANKFTRAVIKTNNIDHCARL